MNKIIIIIKREYLTRIRKRSFLLTTFLIPLFFIGLYVGIIYLTKKSFDETHGFVYVVDQEGSVAPQLKSNKNITYLLDNTDLQSSIELLKTASEGASILLIPNDFYTAQEVDFLSNSKPNLASQKQVQNELSAIIRNKFFENKGINIDSLNNLNTEVAIKAKEIVLNGEAKETNTEVAMFISIGLSILIYLSLFMYGSQVMRGIIEEKTSRIIEVIISSVKPFQLMLGKIIGIGLVGITQFVLWLIVTLVLVLGASAFYSSNNNVRDQLMEATVSSSNSSYTQEALTQNEVFSLFESVEITEIVVCFFLFFLGGYLLYSALFAAVGSAIDSETEASQFTMPITMPLLLTYALSFGVLINNPHGTVSTTLSFIPFTSPIAMLVRVPFGVPLWQIAVSFLILAISFVFTTWFASRIYRVGILMYGKKASLKELIKWFNYKS